MGAPAYLGWSPRGDYLIVSREAGTLERYDTSRQGPATVLAGDLVGHQVVIGYSGFNDRSAGLFRPPNGEELLVVSSGSDGLKLRAVHQDGTGGRDLLSQATTDLTYTGLKAAQWSPDGSQVVVMVAMPPDGWNHLYVVNADGSNLHPLNVLSLDLLIDEGSPMWSPNGSKIGFMRWTNHADGSFEDFHPLAIADVAAGTYLDVGRVSTNGYKSWEWSPDGTRILAVPDDGTNEVLIIDATTG
jgi:dipeptidyl aminopeptidase/acylaminoacyl peptidase